MSDKPHHHGNLREALINAGLLLLKEDGLDGLTLRRAAARAGVSHAAPAHHFSGKQGLVAAIAARGFLPLTEPTEAERFRLNTTRSAARHLLRLPAICRRTIGPVPADLCHRDQV
jgi:AcrR family transcriptional regulator